MGDGGPPQLDGRQFQDVLDADRPRPAGAPEGGPGAAPAPPDHAPRRAPRAPGRESASGCPSGSRPAPASPRSAWPRPRSPPARRPRARPARRALPATCESNCVSTERLARRARGRAGHGSGDRIAGSRCRCTCWRSTPPSSRAWRPRSPAGRRWLGCRHQRGLAHGDARGNDAPRPDGHVRGALGRGAARGRVRRRHGDLLHRDQPRAARSTGLGRDLLLDHAADPRLHRCRRRREPRRAGARPCEAHVPSPATRPSSSPPSRCAAASTSTLPATRRPTRRGSSPTPSTSVSPRSSAPHGRRAASNTWPRRGRHR